MNPAYSAGSVSLLTTWKDLARSVEVDRYMGPVPKFGSPTCHRTLTEPSPATAMDGSVKPAPKFPALRSSGATLAGQLLGSSRKFPMIDAGVPNVRPPSADAATRAWVGVPKLAKFRRQAT